jgi:hypothetical protein
MLNSEAQFARTYNTNGVDTDTQAALRRKTRFLGVLGGESYEASVGTYCPPPTTENASFKRTPLAALTASPLRGAA